MHQVIKLLRHTHTLKELVELQTKRSTLQYYLQLAQM